MWDEDGREHGLWLRVYLAGGPAASSSSAVCFHTLETLKEHDPERCRQ